MTLRFIKAAPIVCPNQYINNPPSEPLPYSWLKKNLPDNYAILDFDGYVVNFLQKKITAFLMKKEFEYDSTDDVTDQNIIDLCNSKEFNNNWIERISISKILNVPLFFLFWPKDYPQSTYHDIQKPVFIFQISIDNDKIIMEKNSQVTATDLQEFIFSYRNFKFPNVKSMRIAKSQMECYLSTTSSPWPGDLDGVIFEKSKKKVIGLLEFKTHNLDTDIKDEGVSKYRSQDFRRFKVLNYLQKNLSEKQKDSSSLLFIIWGTKKHHKKIKIQKISDQTVLSEEYVDSPLFVDDDQSFVDLVMKMCK